MKSLFKYAYKEDTLFQECVAVRTAIQEWTAPLMTQLPRRSSVSLATVRVTRQNGRAS